MLDQGQEYDVNIGNLVGMQTSVNWDICSADKVTGSVISKDRLIGRLTGPGYIWLQSNSIDYFVKKV